MGKEDIVIKSEDVIIVAAGVSLALYIFLLAAYMVGYANGLGVGAEQILTAWQQSLSIPAEQVSKAVVQIAEQTSI